MAFEPTHASTVSRAQRRAGLLSAACALAAVMLALAPAAGASADPAPAPSFRVTGEAKIGGEGSWDYLQYDAASRRLFVTRIGGVLVIDTADMKPVGTIPALAGARVHGVALAPEQGIGVTSNGADETATVFDLKTLEVLRRVPLPHAGDAILWDDASRSAVAVGEDDPVVMAFDPATAKSLAEVKLPGSPESLAADGKGAIYVDLSDSGEIARIDTRTWTVDAHWAVGGGCQTPTPMAVDRSLGRLFIGCRSGVLAVVDVAKKALIASLPIGAGADTVVFDARTGLIFVSCNEGSMYIFKATPTGYAPVQTVATAFSARTMALDPEGLRAFLPVADRGPMLPKVGDIPSRPAIVPETFRILTVSQ